MINKIKTLILPLLAMLSLSIPLLAPVAASAAPAANSTTIHNNLCSGANLDVDSAANSTGASGASGAISSCDTNGQTNLNDKIAKVINVLSAVIGVVAVIMIIFGGFRYITSGGNESSVGSAKKTILYALVGLVIVALAQLIVKFVLNSATS
jgi:hypothetical protein